MKLSFWTYILLALCLGASAVLWVLFEIYQPYEQASSNMYAYRDQLQTEANKQSQAENRVRKAIAQVDQAAKDWNVYVDTKTPSGSLATGGIDVYTNPYQLVVDSRRYRDNAQRAFNTQLHAGGVKIVNAPEIPQPTDSEKDILASYYNYPAFNFPVVLWELGTVTVQGTYQQIVTNVRSWTSMPRYLAVVDGLRIDGTSPLLTASYNVTIVGFIKASKVYPPPGIVTSTGSSAGGGTTAGGTGAGIGAPSAAGINPGVPSGPPPGQPGFRGPGGGNMKVG